MTTTNKPFVCVFCGSRKGNQPEYVRQAQELGRALVERGWGLVFGGGHVGLMGVVADAVLEAGGEVIGVIPQSLVDRELAHPKLNRLEIVQTMHERKARMADLSQAFVALPGGFGTADEFFEILTWAQLQFHHKPIGLLNTAGFFDALLTWIDKAMDEDFVKPGNRQLIRAASNVPDLLELIGPGFPQP